jgi:hypothetical protein
MITAPGVAQRFVMMVSRYSLETTMVPSLASFIRLMSASDAA